MAAPTELQQDPAAPWPGPGPSPAWPFAGGAARAAAASGCGGGGAPSAAAGACAAAAAAWPGDVSELVACMLDEGSYWHYRRLGYERGFRQAMHRSNDAKALRLVSKGTCSFFNSRMGDAHPRDAEAIASFAAAAAAAPRRLPSLAALCVRTGGLGGAAADGAAAAALAAALPSLRSLTALTELQLCFGSGDYGSGDYNSAPIASVQLLAAAARQHTLSVVLPQLRSLTLTAGPSPAVAALLEAASRLQQLTYLSIERDVCSVGNKSWHLVGTAMARAAWPQLQVLKLHNSGDLHMLRALSRLPLHAVTQLYFKTAGQPLSAYCAEARATALQLMARAPCFAAAKEMWLEGYISGRPDEARARLGSVKGVVCRAQKITTDGDFLDDHGLAALGEIEWPDLKTIYIVGMAQPPARISGEGIGALLAAPGLAASLESFGYNGCNAACSGTGIVEAVAAARLDGLRELNLMSTADGARAAAAIARAGWAPQLTYLQLRMSGAAPAAALGALAAAPLHALRTCSLYHSSDSSASREPNPSPALAAFAQAPWVAALKELDLSGVFEMYRNELCAASPTCARLLS